MNLIWNNEIDDIWSNIYMMSKNIRLLFLVNLNDRFTSL